MIVEHFPVGLLQCNCIVLADEASKAAIVVDPGDEGQRIFNFLGRDGYEVKGIVATHAHIDHVGALASLKQLTGAPAMIHEGDVPLYEHLAEQAEWLGIATPSSTALDRYLREGDRLELGRSTIEVVHTPGHSPGSVCFMIDEHDLVLSGDTLFAGSIGRTDLWGGSFDEIMASIRMKLLRLDDAAKVIPGHGPLTTIGAERRTNPFITARA